MKLFFSYGHDHNKELVYQLKKDLEKDGHEIWIDNANIREGNDWRATIAEGIMNNEMIIAFASQHTIRNPGVCLDELSIAVTVKCCLVQTIKLEPVHPPTSIMHLQMVDLSDWRANMQSGHDVSSTWYQEKLKSIRELLSRPIIQELAADMEKLKDILRPDLTSMTKNHWVKPEFYIDSPWLFNEISDWVQTSQDKVLVIEGGPGTGKSAFFANSLLKLPNLGAVIYCDWKSQINNTKSQVIRSLAFQLAAHDNEYRKALLRVLDEESKASGILADNNIDPYIRYILRPLYSMIDGDRPTILILIDGLDEVSNSTNNFKNPILDMIGLNYDDLPTWIKFILTTRPTNTIDNSIRNYGFISLDNNTNRDKDVELFLTLKLNNSPYSPLVHSFSLKCQGNFLFASLLCKGLEKNLISSHEIVTHHGGIEFYYHRFFERSFEAEYEGPRKVLGALTISRTGIPKTTFDNLVSEVAEDLEISEHLLRESLQPYIVFDSYGFTLFHKSLGDWLATNKSKEFKINKKASWLTIAKICLKSYRREFKKMNQYEHETLFNTLTVIDEELWDTPLTEQLKKAASDQKYVEYLYNQVTHAATERPYQAYELGKCILHYLSNPVLQLDLAMLLLHLAYELVTLNDIPHLLKIGCSAVDTLGTIEAYHKGVSCCLDAAYNQFRIEKYESASLIYEQAMDYAIKADNPEAQAEIQRALAEMFRFNNEIDQAEEHIKMSLEIANQNNIKESNAVLYEAILCAYGRILLKKQQAKDALDILLAAEQIVLDYSGNFPKNELGVLEYGISSAYLNLNNLNLSKAYAHKSLVDLEKVHPATSVQLADILNQLGDLYLREGNLDSAEHFYKRSFENRNGFYGMNNLLTSISYGKLTNCLSKKDLTDAQADSIEEMFKKTVDIRKAITNGSNEERTVMALLDLAEFQITRGKYSEAESNAKEAHDLSARLNNGWYQLHSLEKLMRLALMQSNPECLEKIFSETDELVKKNKKLLNNGSYKKIIKRRTI